MNNKIEELWNAVKFNELVNKKKMDDDKKSAIFWTLAIIGAVAAIAAIAYAVYRYLCPNYLEDFEDDFDDDFDDDYCDEEDDEVVVNTKVNTEA